MSVWYLLSALIALGLLGYLIYALLKPENFNHVRHFIGSAAAGLVPAGAAGAGLLGAYIARVMQGDNVGPCTCSRR